jgi:hypothetical protein
LIVIIIKRLKDYKIERFSQKVDDPESFRDGESGVIIEKKYY